MDKYLIEVPHDSTEEACVNAVRIFHETGSHFLSNADWGCEDNQHCAWLLVEAGSRKEAEMIIPALFRHEAKIIRLRKFTREDMRAYEEKGRIAGH